MRVVSMVPSLTETLIEAGIEVVGRTRYCEHPAIQTRQIPIVGGTKDLNWQVLDQLNADLLLLDQEENLPWMKSKSPIAVHVFHATSIQSMPAELRKFAALLNASEATELRYQALRWEEVITAPNQIWDWQRIPTASLHHGPERSWERVLYLIWQKPWMSVAAQTFIGSVAAKLGAGEFWPGFTTKYPTIQLEDFDPERTLLLCSSEPYPFAQKWDLLETIPHSRKLVDGAAYSWFGIRSLRFLEKELGLSKKV